LVSSRAIPPFVATYDFDGSKPPATGGAREVPVG
jgi:hypothetical protein